MPYAPGNNNTLIHSHPIGINANNQGANALVPGPGDPKVFSNFAQNIIVGAFGNPQEAQNTGNISRVQGAAFFGRTVTTASKPVATLSATAINRAIKLLR